MGMAVPDRFPLYSKTLAGLFSAVTREISHDHGRQYGGAELLPPLFLECRRATGNSVSPADFPDYLPLAGGYCRVLRTATCTTCGVIGEAKTPRWPRYERHTPHTG